MILVIGLIGVSGNLVYNIVSPYDVELSDDFDNYMNSFSDEDYKNSLDVEASSQSNGDFAEYESSFKFGSQAKETYNQTKTFTKATTGLLGLDYKVWYLIYTIVFVLILLGILAYLRGIGKL